jgi:hypothetical protein
MKRDEEARAGGNMPPATTVTRETLLFARSAYMSPSLRAVNWRIFANDGLQTRKHSVA